MAALPGLLAQGGQLAIQGSGDAALEQAFTAAASAHAGQVAVHLGYDESFAHRMIAGADAMLVPSRFVALRRSEWEAMLQPTTLTDRGQP